MYRIFFVAAVASVWVQTARADLILNTPAGLGPGQNFQIVFVTAGATLAESTDINTYNAFVNSDADTQAGGNVFYNGHVVTFSAMGSTETVSAASNIGANSAPVYTADGTLIATSTTTAAGGLWSGTLLAGVDKDLLGNPNTFGLAWTGSLGNGQPSFNAELGGPTTVTQLGFVGHSGADWFTGGGHAFDEVLPMYAISGVLTVAAAPEPSSMLLTLMGLGAAIGWRLARRREPAEQPQPSPAAHS
jgi:MYXO-CTERM domain-containing protein